MLNDVLSYYIQLFKSELSIHSLKPLFETSFNECNYNIFRVASHDKCPICQSKLTGTNDSWVLSELPKTDEVNEEIVTELGEIANGHDEDEINPPESNDFSD